ncbi:MAG: M48 family metalloprotease, partial [Terriglobales bacterium]
PEEEAMTVKALMGIAVVNLMMHVACIEIRAQDSKTPCRKYDLSRIGNRGVGKGGGLGNWYSFESEIRLGRSNAARLDQTLPFQADPQVREYVNRIGQNLVRNSDARVPFSFKVVASEQVDSYSLPGGFTYVSVGLIKLMESEAELAGIMAHLIAHVAGRHATRNATRGQVFSLGSGRLSSAELMTFSDAFEREADCLGLQYLYATGYDPNAYVGVLEKIQARHAAYPGAVPAALYSHVPNANRLALMQQELRAGFPTRTMHLSAQADFAKVIARLAQQAAKTGTTETAGAPVVPTTALIISSRPGGAQVYLDDEPKGTTSDEGKLVLKDIGVGSRRLRLSLSGYGEWTQALELTAGEARKIEATLVPAGPPPFSLRDILDMLRGEIAPPRVSVLVYERGVNFALTDAVEQQLRAAGADDALLLAITKAKK